MFAFISFLSKVSSKGWVPVTDILGCVVKSVAHEELLSQIASLPDKQARRVYAHFFLNMESSEIAQRENVEKSCVNKSIKHGLKELTKCSNIFSD